MIILSVPAGTPSSRSPPAGDAVVTDVLVNVATDGKEKYWDAVF